MSLKNRIKSARASAGITQAELARRCGVSQPTINDLENGKSKTARSSTLIKLADALGQTPEWLASGSGAMSDAPQLSSGEEALLQDLRRLNASERKIVVRMIRALVIDR